MKKKRSHSEIRKIVTPTFIKAIVMLVPVTLLIVYKAVTKTLTLEEFFSIDTFIAIILAFLCQTLADFIVKTVESKNEDARKLTEDYQSLIKKYGRADLFRYHGVTFPAIRLFARQKTDAPFRFVFDDSAYRVKYQLPSQIAARSDYLMNAHKSSNTYNQLNIRLDDVRREDETNVVIKYSQTFYYDSLITNRSMDYRWENGKTVREIYEPGPFVSALNDSKLSNHLGFHLFLETADGKIIFVKRQKNVSIGKNTWGSSVAASLKAKYALDDEQKFSVRGLSDAIKKEIYDELYVRFDDETDFSQTIFAFYRDLVEGGKPQFLAYYQCPELTFDACYDGFKKGYEKKNNVVDGTEFIGLSLEDCRKCELQANGVTFDGKFYPMTASTVSSFAMLLDYLA